MDSEFGTIKVQIFACDHCDKMSYSKKELEEHTTQTHLNSGNEVFSCDECGEILIGVEACNEHKRRHIKTKLQCPNCGKEFRNNQFKAAHNRRCPGDKGQVWRCEICDYTTKWPASYKQHMSMRMLTCNVAGCGMEFHGNKNLSAHKRNYLHQQPRSTKLNASMNIQSIVFKCGSCTYETMFKTQLRKHEEFCIVYS